MKRIDKPVLLVAAILCSMCSLAQIKNNAQKAILTNEDSLHAEGHAQKTVLSGYGSAYYQHDFTHQHSVASLERIVLFVGHRFNEKISVFTEMELEHALVAGLEEKGEISMEQAFLKFNLNPKQYLVAGLFLPRIGILNENHLPVNFNGVERPLVEQLVIPATWRELGVGFYGRNAAGRLHYTAALVTGINSAGLVHGSGIREGRGEGSRVNANNLAVTASVQYNINDFKLQLAQYAGGTVGLNRRGADSLQLESGMFGSPLYLSEVDVQYQHGPWAAKALGTYIYYPAAQSINKAYAGNTASGMYGAYVEAGYNWLNDKSKTLVSFARAEALDLNAKTPAYPYAIYDGTLKQLHIIAGITYLPIPNVCIKADVRVAHTGPQNAELVINPPPNALPYRQNSNFLNLGIGYSF